VERFLPLARSLAGGYAGAAEPFEDLFQVACVGLIKAIDRFDPDRGAAFSSFAVPTIAGELKRHFRDRTWAVHVPRSTQELGLKVERAAARLTGELARPPSIHQLARATHAEEDDVRAALEALAAYRTTSLEALVRNDDGDVADTIGDTLGRHDDGYGRAEARALLEDLLEALTGRDREVLRLRFEEDLTQSQIAERIGLSQMQISRILRRSIRRLREADRDRGRNVGVVRLARDRAAAPRGEETGAVPPSLDRM
jgi:RNA polymerase sigma-B factor